MIVVTAYCPQCSQAVGVSPHVQGVDLVFDQVQAGTGQMIDVNPRLSVRFDAADVYHKCPTPLTDTHEAFSEDTERLTPTRCRHCGKLQEADGMHSCTCPYNDDNCLDHPNSEARQPEHYPGRGGR